MTKFEQRINKTATKNVKMLDRLQKKKERNRRCGDGIFLTWLGVFRSVAEWSRWFQSFFSSYMRTISHLTNSYTLPCCLGLFLSCAFQSSTVTSTFSYLSLTWLPACFLLLSPISSLAYFLPLIYIFNSWTFLRLMSELAHFQIITLASWNEI